MTRRVMESVRPGDIILLHDIYGSTVDAVPGIIEGMRERGFAFVTVSTLLGRDLNPGQIYTRQRN